MPRFPEYRIADEHILRLKVNTPDAVFGTIDQVGHGRYREVGLVMAYNYPADAEAYCNHWRAECYIEDDSYSSAFLDGLGDQLLAVTMCTEPFMLVISWGDRARGRYKTYGHVHQSEE